MNINILLRCDAKNFVPRDSRSSSRLNINVTELIAQVGSGTLLLGGFLTSPKEKHGTVNVAAWVQRCLRKRAQGSIDRPLQLV
jgi:hypothetical protein